MKNINAEEVTRLKELDKKLKERYRKQNEYTNKIYDRISFTVPAGRKKDIEEVAKNNGLSVNNFISTLVLAEVEKYQHQEQITSDSLEDKPNPVHEIEDFEKLNEYIEQLRADNKQRKEVERALDKAKIENALEE